MQRKWSSGSATGQVALGSPPFSRGPTIDTYGQSVKLTALADSSLAHSELFAVSKIRPKSLFMQEPTRERSNRCALLAA
jgi:hypothetical protein